MDGANRNRGRDRKSSGRFRKKAFALASQEMADGLTETGARQEESEVCSRLLCLVVDSDLL